MYQSFSECWVLWNLDTPQKWHFLGGRWWFSRGFLGIPFCSHIPNSDPWSSWCIFTTRTRAAGIPKVTAPLCWKTFSDPLKSYLTHLNTIYPWLVCGRGPPVYEAMSETNHQFWKPNWLWSPCHSRGTIYGEGAMGWTGAAVTTAPTGEVGVFARSALNKHCFRHFRALQGKCYIQHLSAALIIWYVEFVGSSFHECRSAPIEFNQYTPLVAPILPGLPTSLLGYSLSFFVAGLSMNWAN